MSTPYTTFLLGAVGRERSLVASVYRHVCGNVGTSLNRHVAWTCGMGHVHGHVHRRVCAYMHIDMCIDVCIGMHMDMCMGICIDARIDVCIGVRTGKHASRHVCIKRCV